jgi:hypothetical protein
MTGIQAAGLLSRLIAILTQLTHHFQSIEIGSKDISLTSAV